MLSISAFISTKTFESRKYFNGGFLFVDSHVVKHVQNDNLYSSITLEFRILFTLLTVSMSANVQFTRVWTDSSRDSDGDVVGDSCKIGPLSVADEFKVCFAKEVALLELMEKTGYNMVQENGQRKYGGPPPGQVQEFSRSFLLYLL